MRSSVSKALLLLSLLSSVLYKAIIKALITSYNKEALGSIKVSSLSRLIKPLVAINCLICPT